MDVSIAREIVASAGVIGVAAIGYLTQRLIQSKRAAGQVESEIKFQAAALSFSEFLQEWSGIHEDLKHLFATTTIDRFLLLRAWNGTSDPRWTTAFFQMRAGEQEPINYIHFELDDDYVSKLHIMVQRGALALTTATMPDSSIKTVYEVEGVKSSSWHFIDKQKLDNTPSTSVTYCSFASHDSEKLSDAELLRCKMIADRIKALR